MISDGLVGWYIKDTLTADTCIEEGIRTLTVRASIRYKCVYYTLPGNSALRTIKTDSCLTANCR